MSVRLEAETIIGSSIAASSVEAHEAEAEGLSSGLAPARDAELRVGAL
jgi:hypothetical protein